MAGDEDRVRLDLGFEGGSVLSVAVSTAEADAVEDRLRAGNNGVVELETEDGRLLVILAHVLYVKRYARGSRVGFSAST
jgi:hypothetical protein